MMWKNINDKLKGKTVICVFVKLYFSKQQLKSLYMPTHVATFVFKLGERCGLLMLRKINSRWLCLEGVGDFYHLILNLNIIWLVRRCIDDFYNLNRLKV